MKCIGIADESSRQFAKVGEQLALILPETPTTGYRWIITSLDGPLTASEDRFTPPQFMRPGAGGERRWLLRCEQPGTATLHAELRGRGSNTPGRVFDLTIEIAAAQ